MKPFFRITATLFISITLSIAISWGQGLPTVNPEDLGLSSERLSRIDKVMNNYIDTERIHGAVCLIARHGKIAYLKSFGMMDKESGIPMRNDAIFRIASMTKAITSTALMMLFEEGHFSLNDPVHYYIPEFKNPRVLKANDNESAMETAYSLIPATKEITIRHLLTHTSGIAYVFTGIEHITELYQQAGISDGLSQTEGDAE